MPTQNAAYAQVEKVLGLMWFGANMWKQCDNVKDVTRADEPTENNHLNPSNPQLTTVFGHSTQLFSGKKAL